MLVVQTLLLLKEASEFCFLVADVLLKNFHFLELDEVLVRANSYLPQAGQEATKEKHLQRYEICLRVGQYPN